MARRSFIAISNNNFSKSQKQFNLSIKFLIIVKITTKPLNSLEFNFRNLNLVLLIIEMAAFKGR